MWHAPTSLPLSSSPFALVVIAVFVITVVVVVEELVVVVSKMKKKNKRENNNNNAWQAIHTNSFVVVWFGLVVVCRRLCGSPITRLALCVCFNFNFLLLFPSEWLLVVWVA